MRITCLLFLSYAAVVESFARTSFKAAAIETTTQIKAVSVALEEDKVATTKTSPVTSNYRERAARIVASFPLQADEFDPLIKNCHVQTIGGFFLRDTAAAFVPRDKDPWPRIRQGIYDIMVQRPQQQQQSDQHLQFWDQRERIEVDSDWFHADTKYNNHDWTTSGGNNQVGRPQPQPQRHRHVILIHGLESNSNSSLSQQIAQACLDADGAGVDQVTCLNFRGCSMDAHGQTIPNETPGGYHLGFTDDLKHYLELIRDRGDDIYLVGFSLGANVVLKALGELQESARERYNIQGAAVACAPLDQMKNSAALARPGINRWIYSNGLLTSLQRKAVDQWRRFGQYQTDDVDYKIMCEQAIQQYEQTWTDRCGNAIQSVWNELVGQMQNEVQLSPVQRVMHGWKNLRNELSKDFDSDSSTSSFSEDDTLDRASPLASTLAWSAESTPTKEENYKPASSLFSTASSKVADWLLNDQDLKQRQQQEPIMPIQTNDRKVKAIGQAMSVGGQLWKRCTRGFGQLQPQVKTETIASSTLLGSVVAASLVSNGLQAGDVDPSLTHVISAMALGGLFASYSSVHQGPLGTASRLVGDVGVTAWGCLQSLWLEWNVQTDAATVSSKEEILEQHLFDLPRALAAETITQFDDAFIAPIYKFESATDYYQHTSSVYFLDDIAVPTLILNAEDDPFFDPSVFPTEKSTEAGGSAPLKMVRTKHGGHLGFCFQQVDSVPEESMSSWTPRQLSRFLAHIHENRECEEESDVSEPYSFSFVI